MSTSMNTSMNTSMSAIEVVRVNYADARQAAHLVQLLDQLDGYSLQTQRPITIPLVKSMLENP